MQKFLFGVVVSLVLTLALGGCAKSKETNTALGSDNRILASFSGKTITVGDFMKRVSSFPPAYKKVISAKRDDFLQDVVLEDLMYEQALKKGVDKQKDVIDLVNESRKKIIISKLIETISTDVPVSEQDKKAFYEENKFRFKVPQRIKVSHILVNTKEQADEILKKISDGQSFEELAKQFSIDPSKDRGGDIGYVSKGDLIPDFEETAFKLEVGQTSDVIKTSLGYHIIRVTEKLPEETLSYDKVAGNIEAELKDQKRKDAVMDYADKLKASVKIDVNNELLKGLKISGQEDENLNVEEQIAAQMESSGVSDTGAKPAASDELDVIDTK